MPSQTSGGGGYSGPLAYREGKPMRPDVAAAFVRMAAAARREAVHSLSISSGFRSDAEQARLFALKPTPYPTMGRHPPTATASPYRFSSAVSSSNAISGPHPGLRFAECP
jgi:LAS superfamily LD-carboxypeptidase LdcB